MIYCRASRNVRTIAEPTTDPTDVIDQDWFPSWFILLIRQFVNWSTGNQIIGVVHSYRSVCIFLTGLNYPKPPKMIQKIHYIQINLKKSSQNSTK